MAQDSNLTWEQVQADPRYQNASPQQKQNIEMSYRQSHSAATSASPSAPQQPQVQQAPQQQSDWASDIGDSAASFLKGAAATASHGVVEGLTGLVQAGDTAANKLVGMGPSSLSAYAKRVQDRADEVYKQRQQEAASAGHETAFQRGGTVGQVATDVGTMIAAPEVAIPAIAAREMGGAYARQKEGEKNLASAVAVGGANYLAGKILPGASGEVAEGLLNRGIATAKDVARNAWAGAKGGSLVGATQAVASNPDADLGDVLAGGLRGGTTGAAFGGTFGAANSAFQAAGRKIAGAGGGEISADAVRAAADTPEVAARQAQVIRGSNILADYDIPLRDARLGDDPIAQNVFGKTQADVVASRDVGAQRVTNQNFPLLPERFGGTGSEEAGKMNVTRNQIETGAKNLDRDMRQSLDDASRHLDELSNSVLESNREAGLSPAQQKANQAELAKFNTFKSDFGAYKQAMTKTSGAREAGGEEGSISKDALMARAQKVQDSYNALPDYMKSEFDANFKSVKGFDEGFQPVNHAQDFHEAISQITNQHPNWKGRTEPSQASETNVKLTEPLKAITDIAKAFKAPLARRANLREQAEALEATRNLAQSASRAEQSRASVEASRADMENPKVDDGTQEQMRYSEEEAPTPAPEPTPPQPDSVLARTPRRPNEPEPPVEETVPAPEPPPTPDTSGATFDLAARPRAPETTPEPTEAVATQETPTTVTPEEVAPPQPDQTLIRQPTRPEETPPPEEEVAPTPQPDQSLVREPTRPTEEPAPQETPPEAPPEPSETPKTEPDQALTREPKAREKAPEEPEPAPTHEEKTAPTEDAKFAEKVAFQRDVRAVEALRDQFSTQAVKNKITVESMRKGLDMDQLRHEDAVGNVEGVRTQVKRVLERRAQRQSVVHEENVKHLDEWAKDNDIDPKYVAEAMKGKDQILTTADIKNKARRLQEAENAKNNPTEATGDVVSAVSQRQQAMDRIASMTSPASTELRATIAEKFDPLVKADNTPLTPSQFQKFIVKLHKDEAAINKREGLAAEAKEAEKKATEAAREAAKNAPTVGKQRDELLGEMENMSPEAKKEVEQMIIREFHARDKTGQTMTPTDLATFKTRMYRAEFDANEKAGNAKAAAEAKQKIDQEAQAKEKAEKLEKAQSERRAKNLERAKRHMAQEQLDNQQATIEERIRKELRDEGGFSNAEIEDVVGSHMYNKAYNSLKSPMSEIQERKAYQDATAFAKEHIRVTKAGNEAAKEANLSDQKNKELQDQLREMQAQIDEMTSKAKSSSTKESEKDAARAAEDVLVSEAEKVFRNKDAKLDEVVAAAKALKEAYFGNDPKRSHSVVRFAEVLGDVTKAQEKYPNHEFMWLTHDDVRSLAKTGFKDADGLMDKLVRNVLGMKYGESNLLTNAQRETLAARIERGEDVDVNLMSKKGRAALLEGTTSTPKQKVTVRRRPGSRAGVGNVPVKRTAPAGKPLKAEQPNKPAQQEPTKRKEYGYEADARNDKIISAALKAHNPNTPEPVRKVAREMSKGWDEDQLTSTIKAVGKAKRSLGKFENRSPGEGRYLDTLGYELDRIRKELRKGK